MSRTPDHEAPRGDDRDEEYERWLEEQEEAADRWKKMTKEECDAAKTEKAD